MRIENLFHLKNFRNKNIQLFLFGNRNAFEIIQKKRKRIFQNVIKQENFFAFLKISCRHGNSQNMSRALFDKLKT